MDEHIHTVVDRRTFIAGGTALGTAGVAALTAPTFAFADDPTAEEKLAEADAVRARVTAMQDELATASDNYYKALDEKLTAEQAVRDAQDRIDAATGEINDLQNKLGYRARSMYREGSTSFLDVLLGSSTFDELATGWDLLNQLNENDAEMVQETKDLRTEIEEAKVILEEQQALATQKEQEALEVKEGAEATVGNLQTLLAQLDAEAIALLEKEQAEERARVIAAAQARKTYEYTTNGLDIPSNGTVVDYALSRIGCPYVWGAEGPNAFDCSGLITWAYRQIGIEVPHQTESQFNAAVVRIPVSQAEPGDVLWVGKGDGVNGHVGIAIEAGGVKYVHAPTFGAFVRATDDLSWSGFTHALRFV
ncbi:MAG: NlpC/P60 family protein [Raoultibacter sp.]